MTSGARRAAGTGSWPSPVVQTAGWVVAAGVCAHLTLAGGDWPRPSLGLVVVVAAMVAFVSVGDLLRVHLGTNIAGDSERDMTCVQFAGPLALLVLPPVLSPLVIALPHALGRRSFAGPPLKRAFNASSHFAIATVAAALPAHLTNDSLGLSGAWIAASVAAVAFYELATWVAVVLVVTSAQGRRARDVVADTGRDSATGVVSNTAWSVIAAVLWSAHPLLTLLMVAPMIVLGQAFRRVMAATHELRSARAERDMFELAAAGVADGVALVSAEGTVQVASPVLALWAGVPTEEAVGRHIDELLPLRDDDGASLADLLTCCTPANPRPVRTFEHRSRGRMQMLQVTVAGQFSEGRLEAAVFVVHDLTEEWETRQLKNDFVARVSHELRTPLTPIMTYSQMLVDHEHLIPEADRRSMFASMAERTRHMHRLVEDLLLVSQLAAEEQADPKLISVAPVDIDTVLKQATDDLALAYGSHHIDVHSDGATAQGDADRIRQVVANLVSNACKYSPPGPIHVQVSTRGDVVRIDVRDHGSGIATEDRERIFERFQRVKSSAGSVAGAGVGLYVTRAITEAMGGRVWVSESSQGGTTFSVELPAAAPARAEVVA